MTDISASTFLAIAVAAAVAATVSSLAFDRGLILPAVVLELLLGIVIGPHVLGLHPGQAISFFSDLGLGLLFFFAGYEIDIRGSSAAPCASACSGG